jgi:hypothetical protein
MGNEELRSKSRGDRKVAKVVVEQAGGDLGDDGDESEIDDLSIPRAQSKVVKLLQDLEAPTIEKDNILTQPCTLENIAKYLNSSFKMLQQVKDKNVIMALGNTGCGKSTMLNALVMGPEVLQETSLTITMEINGAGGVKKTKTKKQKVVDLKDEHKE